MKQNSTAKIVLAFFLIALGLALPLIGKEESGPAVEPWIYSGWGAISLAIFLLFPRSVGNVVLRVGVSVLAAFVFLLVVGGLGRIALELITGI